MGTDARLASPLNWNIGVPIQRWGLFTSINGRWNSGGFYTITTGRDDNIDAIYNDRPVGVSRNTLQSDYTIQNDMRVSWTLPAVRPNGSLNFQRGPVAAARAVLAGRAVAAEISRPSGGSRCTCRCRTC